MIYAVAKLNLFRFTKLNGRSDPLIFNLLVMFCELQSVTLYGLSLLLYFSWQVANGYRFLGGAMEWFSDHQRNLWQSVFYVACFFMSKTYRYYNFLLCFKFLILISCFRIWPLLQGHRVFEQRSLRSGWRPLQFWSHQWLWVVPDMQEEVSSWRYKLFYILPCSNKLIW